MTTQVTYLRFDGKGNRRRNSKTQKEYFSQNYYTRLMTTLVTKGAKFNKNKRKCTP